MSEQPVWLDAALEAWKLHKENVGEADAIRMSSKARDQWWQFAGQAEQFFGIPIEHDGDADGVYFITRAQAHA
jgi:hypothetical protein